MNIVNIKNKTEYSVIDIAAILYLALPLIIFILGWIEPLYSVPAVLVLSFAICVTVHRASIKAFSLDVLKQHSTHILPSIFLVAGVMFLAGVTGNWSQHNDYLVRNDIFVDLVSKSWPPDLPDGKYFIYYFQTWLPAALVGCIAGWKVAQWTYYIWIVVGLLFVLYYTFRSVGCINFWVALLFLIWNGAELIPCSLIAPLTRNIAISDAFFESNHVAEPFVCFGPSSSLRSISHCFVPIALICGMLLKPSMLRNFGVFLGICAVMYSPMAAIFLLPCLVYLYIREFFNNVSGFKMKTCWSNAAASLLDPLSIVSYILFAFVIAPYYLSASAASPFRLENITWIMIFSLLYFLFWNVGIAIIFIQTFKKDNFVWVALVSCFLCMLASVCINNDMAMKGSAICNYFLLILFVRAFQNAESKYRMAFVIYVLAISSYLILFCGAGAVAIAGIAMYGFLHWKRKWQYLSAFIIMFVLIISWWLKPSLYITPIDKLLGKKQLYSKNIGIYQVDGGSGRWWWYKTFPPKEDMPVWFKR